MTMVNKSINVLSKINKSIKCKALYDIQSKQQYYPVNILGIHIFCGLVMQYAQASTLINKIKAIQFGLYQHNTTENQTLEVQNIVNEIYPFMINPKCISLNS